MQAHTRTKLTRAASRDQGNVTSDIKQRRERGRAAQAAFRKRQLQTIQLQHDQLCSFAQSFKGVERACSKLKAVVQSPSSTEQAGIPLQVATEVFDLLEAALKSGLQKSVLQYENAKVGAQEVEDLVPKQPSMTAPRPTQSDMPTPEHGVKTPESLEEPATIIKSALTISPDAREARATSHTINTSGSNNRENESDHNSSRPSSLLRLPMMETIPYVRQAQHTQYTFAGKLFWSTLSLAYRLISRPDSNPSSHRMFAYYLQDDRINRDVIAHRIKSRLILGCTDVVEDEFGPDSELSHHLNGSVIEQMTRKGEQVQQYLDPREVELYLRRRWIDLDTFDLQPNMATGGSCWDSSAGDVRTTLVERLSNEAVCFGDSPRYHVNDVESALSAALAANTVGARGQGLFPTTSAVGDTSVLISGVHG